VLLNYKIACRKYGSVDGPGTEVSAPFRQTGTLSTADSAFKSRGESGASLEWAGLDAFAAVVQAQECTSPAPRPRRGAIQLSQPIAGC